MTRRQTVLFRQLLLVFDVLLTAAVFVGALHLREWLPTVAVSWPGVLGPLAELEPVMMVEGYDGVLLGMLPLWWLALHHAKTADFHVGLGRLAWRYTRAVGLGLGLLVMASFVFKLDFLSRSLVVMFGALQLGALVLGRVAVMEAIRRGRRVDDHRVLIVGCGEHAARLAASLRERSSWNTRLVGHLSVPGEVAVVEPALRRGLVSDLGGILDSEVVDEVLFAVPGRSPEAFQDALTACADRGVDVLITMPPSVPSSGKVEIANVTGFNMPMLGLTRTPSGEGRLALKRIIDVLGSSVLIVLAAPVMLLAALAIKIDSRGPVLFRQVRSGRNGRKFVMLKFRSMCVDAEKRREELLGLNEMDGPVFKIKRDPRVTRVGQFIRKTSIDELPQLFNVLLGHMSLVGPRPPLPSEVAQYEPWQRRRLSVRPGITGMWQVSGRNDVDFAQWMKLDLHYIDQWSLWLDLKILFRTVPAVLLRSGAS